MNKQKEFKEYTFCDDCPCISVVGCIPICKLKYNSELMVNKKAFGIYCSDNCELNNIDYGNIIFRPSKVKATTDLYYHKSRN